MTLKDILIQIKEDGPPLPNDGICANVDRLSGHDKETSAEFEELMASWPESQDQRNIYPVEGSAHHYFMAQRHHSLWDNPKRHALLDWMIGELS